LTRDTRRRGKRFGTPTVGARGPRAIPAVASLVIVRCGLLKGLSATIRFAAAGVMGFALAFAAAISWFAIFLAM
jgi:hypothetical protein